MDYKILSKQNRCQVLNLKIKSSITTDTYDLKLHEYKPQASKKMQKKKKKSIDSRYIPNNV